MKHGKVWKITRLKSLLAWHVNVTSLKCENKNQRIRTLILFLTSLIFKDEPPIHNDFEIQKVQ